MIVQQFTIIIEGFRVLEFRFPEFVADVVSRFGLEASESMTVANSWTIKDRHRLPLGTGTIKHVLLVRGESTERTTALAERLVRHVDTIVARLKKKKDSRYGPPLNRIEISERKVLR